jgi:hypothetical protein
MTSEITRRGFGNGIEIGTTSFADFEREIRDEIGRMPGRAGIDFDRAAVELTAQR